MRRAFILSVAVHGGLLGLVLLALAAPRPFEASPEQAVMVDVVAPGEVPQPSSKPPENAADGQKGAAVEQQAASAPASQAEESALAARAIMPGFLDPAGTLAMYNLRLPSSQFDSKAETQANLTGDEIANFKARLRRCWRPPAALASSSSTRVVIRVSLAPDGSLAGDPILIEASAARDGPFVMRTALQAISECQPFGFLPRDRYREWKELDVSFSARDMTGG